MSRRDNYGGLYGAVIGAAVLLALVIAYFLVLSWWERRDSFPAPAAQAPQSAPSVAQPPQRGGSETPTTMPMLLMRAAPRRPGASMSNVPAPTSGQDSK